MDLSWLSAIIVGAAGCLALGYFVGASYPPTIFRSPYTKPNTNDKKKKKANPKDPFEVEKLADILEDFKMVFSQSIFEKK